MRSMSLPGVPCSGSESRRKMSRCGRAPSVSAPWPPPMCEPWSNSTCHRAGRYPRSSARDRVALWTSQSMMPLRGLRPPASTAVPTAVMSLSLRNNPNGWLIEVSSAPVGVATVRVLPADQTSGRLRSMSETKRIGIVGLGRIGAGVARKLLAADYEVTAYDVRAEAFDEVEGVARAQTPAEVGDA